MHSLQNYCSERNEEFIIFFFACPLAIFLMVMVKCYFCLHINVVGDPLLDGPHPHRIPHMAVKNSGTTREEPRCMPVIKNGYMQ